VREVLTSANLPQPRFRYSPCVRIGDTYQMAGMIALDHASGRLEAGGPEAEARKILANLLKALPDFGLTLDDLLIARVFTTRFDDFPSINKAWEEVFGAITPPARTAMGVAALPLGATVEIEFTFQKSAEAA